MSFLKWLLIRPGTRIEKVSVDRIIPARMVVNPEASGKTLRRQTVRTQPRGSQAGFYNSWMDAYQPIRCPSPVDEPSNPLQSFSSSHSPSVPPDVTHRQVIPRCWWRGHLARSKASVSLVTHQTGWLLRIMAVE